MSTDPPRPACTRDDATAVVRRLRDAGHVAYFAGGCVRDLLLGRDPKDFDVATDAPPGRVRQLFHNTQAVGAAFGVILVRLGRSTIEVATFRTDGTYTDGRRPDAVTFATAEEDAKRRDFTINGLFMDPLDGDRVIDFVGGRADLDATLIRAIGDPDARFAEDHLRLLRAVRFAARLGFAIESATAEAVRRHAAELRRVSPERVADELRRMLAPRQQFVAWRFLVNLGLAEQAFRHLPREGDRPWEVGTLFTNVMLHGPPLSFGAAVAVVALDRRWQSAGRPPDVRPWLTRPAVDQIVRAARLGLKVSNAEADELAGTLTGVAAMLVDPPPGVAAMKRFLATPTAPLARRLLLGLGESGVLADVIEAREARLVELSRSDVAPPPLVTGDDLTAAGLTPGPAFKRALDAAYDAQLEGRVTDRAAALALALDVIGR